jgi:hypothetical protein
MTAMATPSGDMTAALCAAWLSRRRLTSRSDVKRAQRACRSRNRALMRGGKE